MPNDVNTQYAPAPTVTRMVAFGTSSAACCVSSAIGATMSKAAIARTANSSAFRNPVHPAVAAPGNNGLERQVPVHALLDHDVEREQEDEAGLDRDQEPHVLAETRMSRLVRNADTTITDPMPRENCRERGSV